ncbi:DNA translocase FtsK [Fructilactobacillus carniphilus]|uniref:DNA translocase FtsK n=1 Tax=Fructilactobacillus carniphilus TaxID=2940297 RepID=A0ABY5C0Q5_9LACO|nr:DNA translocase FtsK [Fructilactobacillus carniphilus]USS90886.1 FtsK/SpoIIIE domain-containing protein [Fructilactobacillus carniphilus]
MAARKSTKKRTTPAKTKRRRTTTKTKKNRRQNRILTYLGTKRRNLLGLVGLILSGLGIFKLGIVGVGVANLTRLGVGNLYPVVLLITAVLSGLTFLELHLPRLSERSWLGLICVSLGVLMGASILQFNGLGLHIQLIQITWESVLGDLSTGRVSADAGGGLLGAGLLLVFAKLFSWIGATILALGLILTGILLLLKVNVVQGLRQGCKLLKACLSAIQAAHHRRKLAQQSTPQQHAKAAPSTVTSTSTTPTSNEEPQPSADASVSKTTMPDSTGKSTPEAPAVQVASERPAPEPEVVEPNPMVTTDEAEGDYQLPSVQLLRQIAPEDQTDEVATANHNSETLQETLRSFGIDAQVKNVSLGPSVTEYELEPAVGVKVSKIVNLSDDLALALAAKDIRIEAPIPGKSLIGIEVPNREVATVSFREVFERQSAQERSNFLTVPLGKDVNGNVVSCNLTKMPHLLIAGSTGSGKSVAINGMLVSLLLKARPDQVKLMLIDPKRVELGVYNGIPHLLSPVVSDPKKAARALHKVVSQMEERYELFAKSGQRKIEGYNQFVKEQNEREGTHLLPLPYIVVVVDELADLMMTVSNEVESAIIRLAQMGRAAGVHMVLATQRPSVDVITGLIKANVPSRIAFAVSSGIDSRTILDANGAEKLLGRGDMLYQPIGQTRPNRVQGSFISDADVETIVAAVKKEGQPEYDDNLVVTDAEMEVEAAEEDQDPLFDEALAFVVHEHKASTSMLQRRFRIGYNRAARIIDDFEQRGYVGPQRGSTPRTVYKQETDDQ